MREQRSERHERADESGRTYTTRTADLTRRTRVRRAPEAFEHALLALLAERDFDGITATDVIRVSGYSRGSFYRYYTDLDDLLEKLVAGEVARYADLVADAVSAGLGMSEYDRVQGVALSLLDHVERHALFYRALFDAAVTCIGFEEFCARAIERFRGLGRLAVQGGGEFIDEDFYYYCTTRSFLVYVKYWVEQGCAQDKELIARQIAVMNSGTDEARRPRFVREGTQG